jgi:putative membrane protein
MKIHRSATLRAFVVAAALTSSTAYADSPREFLQKALEGDNSEIMLGRLAADRARSPRVRDFGNMLVTDHSQAKEELLEVARRMGVRDQGDVAPEAQEERRRLSRMGGRDFDREFVRYMVDDHRKDVAAFRDEAGERHGPVSELAGRQLPTLRHHLEMAMDLDRGGDGRGRMDRGDYRPDGIENRDQDDRDGRDRDRTNHR